MVKSFSRRAVSLGCVVLLILLFTGGCEELLKALSQIKELEWRHVPLYSQETARWCWAASAQMVMHYLGTDVSQCTQANNRFGRTDCCNIDLCPPPTETPCDVTGGHACACGGWPEFGRYGFTCDTTSNAPLSWSTLKTELFNRPFCVTWHWPGGGGHMMAVVGCMELTDGTRYVGINDPWAPCTGNFFWCTYNYYDQHPGHHTHWDDYYNVVSTSP